MEVEAKFALRQPVTPEQVETLPWAPYQVGERHVIDQHDVFLDTSDRKLGRAHYALRLRHANGRLIATLKGLGMVESGVHTREEWEGPAADHTPAGWPEEIRARLQPLVGTESLEPLLEVHNRRYMWALLRDSVQIGELALDKGTIVAAERQLSMHELEIELKGGKRSDLTALCAVVQYDLPAQPEDRSKLARGLALLENREPTMKGGD
jgi:triphosphatase